MTLKDGIEGLIVGLLFGISAFIGLTVYNQLFREYPIIAVIAGIVTTGICFVIGFRFFLQKLDELSQEKWRKRLPVLLLPAPAKMLSAPEKDG